MDALMGRVAIVTGAGSGLGRAYALALARAGARVVVNDLGTDLGGALLGEASEVGAPAERVVREIVEAGGQAVESRHDVADWDQAAALVDLAISRFGDLHVLVTNAGFLRDRTIANMTEDEWDAVIRVHLKGQVAPTRHAMHFWRERARESDETAATDRSVICISSASGLRPSFGQASYGAAKLGIVGFGQVVALEGARFGVRANVLAPSARTRMTAGQGGLDKRTAESDTVRFDPAAVAPLVVWLATPSCPATGQVFHTDGRRISVLGLPPVVARLERTAGWAPADLDAELPSRLAALTSVDDLLA